MSAATGGNSLGWGFLVPDEHAERAAKANTPRQTVRDIQALEECFMEFREGFNGRPRL